MKDSKVALFYLLQQLTLVFFYLVLFLFFSFFLLDLEMLVVNEALTANIRCKKWLKNLDTMWCEKQDRLNQTETTSSPPSQQEAGGKPQ